MKRAVATVVATRRSAPRPVGSKLLVGEDGSMEGSVSGGCVESEVYEACRGVLRGESPRLITYGISDEQAFTVGLPCGGEIDVFVREYDPGSYERIGDRRAVVYTDLESGEQRLVFEGEDEASDALIRGARSQVVGQRVRGRVRAAAAPARLRRDRHRGGALRGSEAARLADDRRGRAGRFATAERIPSADELIVAWPEDALDAVQPDHATAVVVLTHDEKFDLPALDRHPRDRRVLRRRDRLAAEPGEAARALLEAGVSEEALERIHGPAGLDLGAHTPEETALSILAEILAVRAGRSGGALRESTQRIHAEV